MFEVEKPKVTSLESQETFRAVRAMTQEEQRVAIKAMDSDIVWDEMKRRFDADRNMITEARALFKVKDV